MFNGKRFVTSGIAEKVPLELQVIMWNMIDTMDEPKDYLQVFYLLEENGKQKIVHSQEQLNTRRSICLKQVLLVCKDFVIDDVTHSTMLFNYEY